MKKGKSKIIRFKEAIQDIEFSYIDGKNNFDMNELNRIICFKIDLLFKKFFPRLSQLKDEEGEI